MDAYQYQSAMQRPVEVPEEVRLREETELIMAELDHFGPESPSAVATHALAIYQWAVEAAAKTRDSKPAVQTVSREAFGGLWD